MKNSNQIRQLLIKALKRMASRTHSFRDHDAEKFLNQALTLLPPCKTCNGTGEIGTGIGEDGRRFDMRSPEIIEPCSDCN